MGNSKVLDLGDVTVRWISVSEMDNNVYLLTHRSTGSQVLIDAADDVTAIEAMVEEAGADVGKQSRAHLEWIVTTHQHWDHVRALPELAATTGASTACGRDDAGGIDVEMDRLLDDGDVLRVPGFTLEIIHLRGHTPGSIALVYRNLGGSAHIFTGDSLFPGGVGKTNSQEDFESLINDVETRLFDRFEDTTIIHPGHGASTDLQHDRAHLGEWRARGW